MVQTIPLAADRLASFERVDNGSNTHGKTLEALLLDPWWTMRRSKVWDIAAHESAGEPIMQTLANVMSDVGMPFGAAVLAEKWQLARSCLQQWQNKLRIGAADFVIDALVKRARFDTSCAKEAEASEETVVTLNTLSCDVKRLSTMAKPEHTPALQKIEDELCGLVRDKGAKVGLSHGNAVLAQLEGVPMTEADADLLSVAYDGCVGLPVQEEVRSSRWPVLKKFSEHHALAANHCKVGGLLASFLGDVRLPASQRMVPQAQVPATTSTRWRQNGTSKRSLAGV